MTAIFSRAGNFEGANGIMIYIYDVIPSSAAAPPLRATRPPAGFIRGQQDPGTNPEDASSLFSFGGRVLASSTVVLGL